MRLCPINSRFILEPLEEKEEKIGLLYVPVSSNRTKATDMARVISGSYDADVEIGNTVFFDTFTVKPIIFENKTLIVAKKEDILAVVKDK